MDFHVSSAAHVEGYRIRLGFRDGSSGVVDLSSFVDPDNVFQSFRDPEYFRRFRIEYGTLVWGSGDVDIAPEALYEMATGKTISYLQHKTAV